MTWLDDWDEAGRRRQDRLAGRPVVRRAVTGFEQRPVSPPGSVVPPRGWGTPPVDRSVHMRPAETQHPSALERARAAVADRVDTAIARSVAWLLSRSGLGR